MAPMLGAACAPTQLVLVPPPQSDVSLRPAVSSVVVRDVALPDYAASDQIALLQPDGTLRVTRLLWADAPERAIRDGLVAALGDITGARVAAEPWPFSGLPSAELTVRVSRLVAQPSGVLDFAGQYAVAPLGATLSDRAGRFAIRVPLAGDGAGALGRAQALAVADLAETIARDLAG